MRERRLEPAGRLLHGVEAIVQRRALRGREAPPAPIGEARQTVLPECAQTAQGGRQNCFKPVPGGGAYISWAMLIG